MIHEFAVEPELAATWNNRQNFRYFIEKFGLGSPRIISRYPKRWKKLVWQVFESTSDINKSLDKTRMIELLERLTERMTKRRDNWNSHLTWLENVENEHLRIPFHAILSCSNPRQNSQVLTEDKIDESQPLWNLPSSSVIKRTSHELAKPVETMLRFSKVIIFIDPYFDPNEIKYQKSMRKFLSIVFDLSPTILPDRVEIHTSTKKGIEYNFFEETAQQHLAKVIPEGFKVLIKRWEEKDNGEKLHNRYIITDLGGVLFNTGLDEGLPNQTDDVSLLDCKQYQIRYQQYAGPSFAFNLADQPLEINGILNI